MGDKILVGSNFTGFKNRIINGDFSVWQRGEDVTGQDGYLAVDRFRAYQETDGNNFDIRNLKVVENFENIARWEVSNIDSDATYNILGITQRVEPIFLNDLIGQKIVISFNVRTNKTNLTFYIKHNYTDSDGNEQEEIIFSEDISVIADTWNRIEKVVLLDSDALRDETNTANWIELFAIKADVVDNDYFELKQVQVEKGAIATEFERIPYNVQLDRCLRYYEKIENTICQLGIPANIRWTYGIKLINKRVVPSIKYEIGFTDGDFTADTQFDWITISKNFINVSFDKASSDRNGTLSTTFFADAEL